MECSCEQLADCMEENILKNQGSDVLTLCLLCFILLITYIQNCIEENNN
mgnify:FL=1